MKRQIMEEIMAAALFKREATAFFGGVPYEAIARPRSVVVKLVCEPAESTVVKRLLLIPPGGCTSNEIGLLSPHPDVRKAKIAFKGGVRPEREGFTRIDKQLLYAFFEERNAETYAFSPYAPALCHARGYYEHWHSSGEPPFFVVKEDGNGHFHNLINLSNELVLLELEIERAQRRPVKFVEAAVQLPEEQGNALLRDLELIASEGDEIFDSHSEAVEEILAFPSEKAVPALLTGLNVLSAGRHEPCTFYALLLKVARKSRESKALVRAEAERALRDASAPDYYLRELLEKI